MCQFKFITTIFELGSQFSGSLSDMSLPDGATSYDRHNVGSGEGEVIDIEQERLMRIQVDQRLMAAFDLAQIWP